MPSSDEQNDDLWGWDSFVDTVEKRGKWGEMLARYFLRRLSVEAPTVLGYALLCTILFVINIFLPGISKFLACPAEFSMMNPMQYVRLVTHVFGHDGYQHLKNNMVHLMLVGPSAEKVFGSSALLKIMLYVAVASAVTHIWVGRARSWQLGASGEVFALILLNSLVSAKSGTIPVSFVITALLWISDEAFKMFFSSDGVSHHAHLTGGLVGTMAGYMAHSQRAKTKTKEMAKLWRLKATKKKKG